MVFGRSGGVQGHGMDHTNRFPRTLVGSGLAWHGGSRFSCFLEILETHFITKYLQIVPLASRLVLGFFWKPGHQIKPINFPKKYSKEKYVSGTWTTSANRYFVNKMLPFLFPFFGGGISHGFSMDRFSMDFPWRPEADKKCGEVVQVP